jgi:hypothetical protein
MKKPKRAMARSASIGLLGGGRAPTKGMHLLRTLGTTLTGVPTCKKDRTRVASKKFRIRPSAGSQAGQNLIWTAKDYCNNLQQAAQRLQVLTGQSPLPLFRAPGGKTSPKLIEAARQCGFAHVGWAEAGFLGDELPSNTYPNAQLLQKALKSIRSGDVLMAHLGIWSRQDPWAPAVLGAFDCWPESEGPVFCHPARASGLQRLDSPTPHDPAVGFGFTEFETMKAWTT